MNIKDYFPPKNPEEAALAALAFFDVFDYPLKLEEVERYMMVYREGGDELRRILRGLNVIENAEGFYFLQGRKELIEVRRRREGVAADYWDKVRKYVRYLREVPFVKGAAVCNTLAFGNASRESDIDLFIITEKGKIFTARTLSALLMDVMGVRRKGDKIAGRFCMSFYLSEDAMDLSTMRKGGDDVYLAFWMRSLKPIFGEEIFDRFFEENDWVAELFKQSVNESGRPLIFGAGTGLERVHRSLLSGGIGSMLERKLERDHLKRHEVKKAELGEGSSVVVNKSMLKYHNIDRRNEFNDAFFKRYSELLGLS